MSSDTKAAMLACAQASPQAVAAHDKAAWLRLFADDGVVNDPVGSRPHQGADALSRFYDTFIAPNEVRFDVTQDIVSGDTVARDVTIRIHMATGLEVAVPAHLRYELEGPVGALRIRRLSAHWELLPMVLQTLRQGWIGLRTYSRLSLHMLRCQGIGGVLGFMRGFGGVGRRGKRRVELLLQALRDRDSEALRRMLNDGTDMRLSDLPDPSIEALAARSFDRLQWDKLIAAGQTVTATVQDGERRGIALFEFGKQLAFLRVRFYFDHAMTPTH